MMLSEGVRGLSAGVRILSGRTHDEARVKDCSGYRPHVQCLQAYERKA
nr:hypothetical protein [Mucilaginibacter sp. X5P1]